MTDPAGEWSFLLRIAEPETREQGAGLAGTGQNTALMVDADERYFPRGRRC